MMNCSKTRLYYHFKNIKHIESKYLTYILFLNIQNITVNK